jgi:serine/threonine-protein kinase
MRLRGETTRTQGSDARFAPSVIAADRSTTPQRLRQALRGDLDTIVLKALKKRPAERYASVLALAEDLERHLGNQPVLAQPDSLAYRSRKYLRRNRLEVALVGALALGLVASLSLFVQARNARLHAERETAQARALSDFLQFDLLQSITADRSDTRRMNATKELLDTAAARISERLASQPLAAIKLRGSFGEAYVTLGFYKEAYDLQQANQAELKRALDANRADALEIGSQLTSEFHERDFRYPLRLAQLAAEQWPANDLRRLNIENSAAHMLARRGRYTEAQAMFESFDAGIANADPEGDDYRNLWVYGLDVYAEFFQQRGDHARALEIFQRVLDRQLRDPGFANSGIGWTRAWIALSLIPLGRLDEAEQQLQTIIDESAGKLNPTSYLLVAARIDLGLVRCMQGRFDEARALSDPAFALNNASASTQSPGRALPREWMATQAMIEGRHDRAEALLREAIAILEPAVPADSLAMARDRVRLTDSLRAQDRLPEARAELDRVTPDIRTRLLANPLDVIELRRAEGLLARAQGRTAEAQAALDEALSVSRRINGEKSFWTRRLVAEVAGPTGL